MPAAGHTASAVPAMPTASAHPASTSRFRPGSDRPHEPLRQQVVDDVRVHLHAWHLPLGEGHGVEVAEARGGRADDHDPVAEHGRVHRWLLAGEDLLLRIVQVVEAVILVGRLAVLFQHRAGEVNQHPLGARLGLVKARNACGHERRQRGPHSERFVLAPDRLRLHGPRQHHRGDGQRGDPDVADAHERRRAPHRPVGIVDAEVVAHGRRRVGEFGVRQDDAGPRLERRVGRERLARAKPLDPAIVELGQFVGGHVGREHDVARARRRRRQRAVRLGATPGDVVDLERPLLAFGEEHVVDDDLRRGAGEVVDQGRVDHARPRPAARVRLEAADAAVVDADEHDVAPRRRRVRRHADAVVVGLELDGLEERGLAGGPRQRRRRRANGASDQEPPRPTLHQDTCSPCASPSSGPRMAG